MPFLRACDWRWHGESVQGDELPAHTGGVNYDLRSAVWRRRVAWRWLGVSLSLMQVSPTVACITEVDAATRSVQATVSSLETVSYLVVCVTWKTRSSAVLCVDWLFALREFQVYCG